MAINKVIMTGRLTADPELKHTPNGLSVCSFSIAQNRSKDAPPNFFDCVAWRQTAEFLSKYFQKGCGVEIVGYLDSRTYEKNGVKRKVVEIVCENVSFPSGLTINKEATPALPSYGSINEAYEELSSDDELPFN